MSKRKKNKNKTETVNYDSPDRATLESAVDSMSDDVQYYREELEILRADIRAAHEEIDLKRDRIRELERTVICLASELTMARNIIRSESAINEITRARNGEYDVF
jgi:chromosome segregation ATPase